MNVSEVTDLLIHGNNLKQMPRAGWLQRGLVQAENVAGHSFGTIFIALVMSEIIAQPLSLEKVLAMAVLHDLPEGVTTDIPPSSWQFFPSGIKTDVERNAMQAMIGEIPIKQRLMAFWEELQANDSAEANLVHDCDKLDMHLQAFVYEQQTGNQQLTEFWDGNHQFAFAETQAIFDYLLSLRKRE